MFSSATWSLPCLPKHLIIWAASSVLGALWFIGYLVCTAVSHMMYMICARRIVGLLLQQDFSEEDADLEF